MEKTWTSPESWSLLQAILRNETEGMKYSCLMDKFQGVSADANSIPGPFTKLNTFEILYAKSLLFRQLPFLEITECLYKCQISVFR